MRTCLEYCAENATLLERAIDAGANRIELCDNLAVGGTTPSYGTMQYAISTAHDRGVPVMVMIRPRSGDFEYSKPELDIMEADIFAARRLGADGVVLGCLHNEWLDELAIKRLMYAARNLDVTFHMAFDPLPNQEIRLRAIDWLAQQGVRRILTHGGPLETPIEQNLEVIRRYIDRAAGRLTILPGGGITYKNVHDICEHLDVCEAHGTRIVELP
jgi:copper homeostasis protein